MLGGVLDFSEVRFRGRGARGRVLLIEIYKMMSRRAYVWILRIEQLWLDRTV